MTILRDCITIKFTNVLPEPSLGRAFSQIELRQQFWASAIVVNTSVRQESDPLILESTFNKSFGRALRYAILDQMYISSDIDEDVRGPRVRRQELLLVTIEARVVSYSSMEAAITIGGIEHLAKLFEGNYESFMILLESAIDPALQRIFPYSDYFVEALNHEVRGSSELERQFDARPAPPTPPVEPGARTENKTEDLLVRRAQRIWMAVQLSFLVPVLLVLIIVYETYLGMSSARERQESLMATNVALQTQMLNDALARERARFQTPTPAPTPTP